MIDSLELVRSLYAGFALGDVDAALERSAVDVTIDQDPRLPWGGHYVGRAGVVEFLTKLTTMVDTTIKVEHLFRAGDDVVECGRSIGTVRGTGAAIDVPECHIWTIRDGTIFAARFYIDTDTVLAALRTEPALDPTWTPTPQRTPVRGTDFSPFSLAARPHRGDHHPTGPAWSVTS